MKDGNQKAGRSSIGLYIVSMCHLDRLPCIVALQRDYTISRQCIWMHCGGEELRCLTHRVVLCYTVACRVGARLNPAIPLFQQMNLFHCVKT
jgi:hypothetical protein